MSLTDWRNNGWLDEHQPSRREIADLFLASGRDIESCRVPGLSPDWKFAIAYNAALQAANAALAAAGFRAKREAFHFRVIQSLRFTIAAEPDLIEILDNCRRKRNLGTYERAGAISNREADAMAELAIRLRDRITTWMKTSHPELFSPG